MKKLLSLVLAMLMVFSMAVVASAASTTTLTTTVPAANYTLNIPADQAIEFGATKTSIGNVTVTNSAGFAKGKNLQVTVTYDAFSSESVSTTIPFELGKYAAGSFALNMLPSGGAMIFSGQDTGNVAERMNERFNHTGPVVTGYSHEDVAGLTVCVTSQNWGRALAGEYSTTITFTAEVVVEN